MIALLFFLRAEDDALVIDWVDNLLWVAAIAKRYFWLLCTVSCQYNAINLNFIFKSKSVPPVVPYLGRTYKQLSFKHDCKKLTEQKIQGNQLTISYCWPFQRRYRNMLIEVWGLIELVIEFSDCTVHKHEICDRFRPKPLIGNPMPPSEGPREMMDNWLLTTTTIFSR